MSDITNPLNACLHRPSCVAKRQELYAAQDLLREARQFLNAQAYTQEEMDDFCKRLDAHFGIESDR